MRDVTQAKPATNDPEVKGGARDGNEMVVGRVPQGYETKINIRLVPGSDTLHILAMPHILGCQPRQGVPRRDVQAVALPESLVEKLRDDDKKVVEWLAQSTANAHLFLARPVEALIKAGVDLTRSEQKTLERTHRAVREAAVIAPGVKVVDLFASAYPEGRVGELYLFSWEDIPADYKLVKELKLENLINFLKGNFSIDWVKRALIKAFTDSHIY